MPELDNQTKRRTLVTGGAGFVGRHLVDALADRGDHVTALDLREVPAWRPEIEIQQVDLRHSGEVERAIAGHDIVFHNASLVHTKHNRERDVWDVNLGGTENVLAACRKHGVRKLVYVSSASVVYEGRDIEGGDETLGYSQVSQAPYADSKIAAEKLVLAENSPELATVAIRPHVIFGPGDVRLLPAILQRARAGKLKFEVGPGTHLSDFTYIDNLTDALLLAADRLAPQSPIAGQAYFVTNGEPMGFFAFIKQILAKLELPPIRGRVPFALAYGVAAIAEAWDTLKGGTLHAEDGMSRFAIRYLCTHHYFDISKAKRDLGYKPKVSLAEGIERTVAAIRAES